MTDQFDGALARIWRTESAFGLAVDPLADKLLIGSAIYCLILGQRLPWIAVILPLIRHVVFWAARFLSPRGGMMAPGWTGKLSAWMLYTAVGIIIVTSRSPSWLLWFFWTGMALTYVDVIRYAYQTPAVQALRMVPNYVITFTRRTRTGHG